VKGVVHSCHRIENLAHKQDLRLLPTQRSGSKHQQIFSMNVKEFITVLTADAEEYH
jgi:hypothetical protein